MGDQTQGGHDAEQEQEQAGTVEQARADLAAGREWMARDRLTGYLADHYDTEALDLLGEVAFAMRDLPASGAAWFATARSGDDVDAATEAWRERYQDDFAQMWGTLPRSVRERTGNKRVDALRRRAELTEWPEGSDGGSGGSGATARAAEAAKPSADAEEHGSGVDTAVVIAVVIAVFLLVCTVVGFVTVVRWLVPG